MNLTPKDIRKALLRPHDVQLSSRDAHLLKLRSALLDAWEEERRLYADGDDRWTEAADRGAALARQMVEMRAFTLAGLQAKAIAVAHCQHGDEDRAARPADDRCPSCSIDPERSARAWMMRQ